MRRLLSSPFLLCGLLFFGIGCDSQVPDEREEVVLRLTVTDEQGNAVEGLRVGVAPRIAEARSVAGGAATNAAELEDFAARPDGFDAMLTWTTLSETDNAQFAIQQSRTPNQPDPWTTIATATGAGTTTEKQTYAYRVTDLDPGTTFFRLRSVDLGGHPSTIGRTSVTIGVLEDALRGPFPNPFVQRATASLDVSAAQRVEARLLDLRGTPQETLLDRDVEPGRYAVQIEGGDHPDGLYQIEVIGDTFADTTYALLQRPEPVVSSLGRTGSDGTLATDARHLFPSLIDDLPPITLRDAQGNALGRLTPSSGRIAIRLTDPATGTQRTYERVMTDATNSFTLTWTP